MTPLRQRMLHELQRRNYAPSTIRSYLGAVQQFAEHFHCSPEHLGPEHLRRYQIFLLQDKKLEPSTVEIRISALRFLYKRTLRRRDFTYDDLIFPKVPQKLPIVLSQEEVVRLIDAAPNRLYRMIVVLLYATGVRRTEAARIKVEDIDSKRMVIHIRQGKGARDRMYRSRRSCSRNCAVTGRGRSHVGTSFPAPQASAASISPSLIRPSGTPAASRLRAPDLPRRAIRTCCAIASRRIYSKRVPTCAPFSC